MNDALHSAAHILTSRIHSGLHGMSNRAFEQSLNPHVAQPSSSHKAQSSPFRRSAYVLLVAAATALMLLLAASRADAQEGRSMRDEGIRYLKLAGTYRETRDYELALKYANKGLQMVTNLGSRYWEAAGYEALGLIYRDMGDKPRALDYLRRSSGLYSTIIRQKDGSPIAVNMLIDDIEQSPDASTNTGALRDDLQRNQELNRQLTNRLSALDSRIEQLNGPNANRGVAQTNQQTNTLPSGESRPQGQFAPYGTDKKPLAKTQPQTARDTAKTLVPTLPTVVVQLGGGVGFGLSAYTTNSTSNPSGTLSGILGTLSADFFLSQNFSLGLIGGYNFAFISPFTSAVVPTLRLDTTRNAMNVITRIDSTKIKPDTALTRAGIPRYQFVGLRLAYHFVRNQSFDAYLGLSGGVVWPSQLLQWQGGLLLGAQVNFTPFLGMFLDGVVGAANNDVHNKIIFDNSVSSSVIGLGGYARLGFSFSF